MPLSAYELGLYAPFVESRLARRHMGNPILYASNAFFFRLSGSGPKRLALALDDGDPRFYLATEAIEATSLESRFLNDLRKEAHNAYVRSLRQVNGDRVAAFELTVINEVYKEEKRILYFELIPHHANLILTDGSDKIISSFRPGELSDERPMLKGMRYAPPPQKGFIRQEGPFDPAAYEAKCLAAEALLAEKRKADRFSWLADALRRKEKLLIRKKARIQEDIAEADKHLGDGRYGDLLFMQMSPESPRPAFLEADGLKIPLDPAKTPAQNAEEFHKRAKKSRETVKKGTENLRQADNELEETRSALAQLQAADEAGLETLAKELAILPDAPQAKKAERWHGLSRDSLPYAIDFHGTKILFGRSAKQNDCLTFLFDTAKDHYWLHVQSGTGSHVMIKKESPTPEEIEAAAEVAVLVSGLTDGDVMVARRGDVRKGPVAGMALVKEHKTVRVRSVSPEIRHLVTSAQKIKF
jgi:predicted ribosome quality control (RQC) complex YloA/Tae2 family protein